VRRTFLTGASFLLLTTACQPDTITEARDQLGRGDPTSLSISVPITADTVGIDRFLDDSTTVITAAGLLGITVNSQNVSVAIGEELSFEGLNFDAFNFGYEQMLSTEETSTSTTVVMPSAPVPGSPMLAPPPGAITFNTPNGSGVLSATVGTGWVVRTINNSTDCAATISVTTLDSLNTSVVTFPDVPVGVGALVVDSVDAAGATMANFVQVGATVVPTGVCVPTSGSSVSVNITFRPMTLASVTLVNVNEPFSDSYAALAGESRVQSIDTIVAQSGSFTLTAQNKLPIAMNFAIQLQGIFRNGANVSGNLVIPAALGGATTSGVLIFDMTGDTIVPSEVLALVSGSAVAASATITPAVIIDAVSVAATGDLVVEKLIGSLDPAQTPELTVDVEDFVTVTTADFDFDDFEDAIRDATINDAQATLVIRNTSGVPITLQNFTMSVAQIDPATGEPQRDINGDFILELDGTGNPIGVLVSDPGDTVLAIARAGSKTVTLDLAPVADRIVDLTIDNGTSALIATGTAVAGDGSVSAIGRSDIVDFSVDLVVGLDLTLPASGVTFQLNEVEAGADLEPLDADAVAARATAEISSSVTNGTPFALRIEVAFVAGSAGFDVDVFQRADRVELTPVTVAAPAVDAQGVVTTPTTSQVSVPLTGAQLRQALGEFVSASIRITLLPGTGGGGRTAVRATDEILLNVFAEAEIVGGSQ
jgi:hypothetical protein